MTGAPSRDDRNGVAREGPRSVMIMGEGGCQMVRASHLFVCSLIAGLGMAFCGADAAAAEPTEACRDLAARFSTAPGQLDLKSLATLGICVSTELGERAGAAEPSTAPPGGVGPPPSPPNTGGPSPAPGAGATPPLTRRYGDWPLPQSWVESWPSPNPW